MCACCLWKRYERDKVARRKVHSEPGRMRPLPLSTVDIPVPQWLRITLAKSPKLVNHYLRYLAFAVLCSSKVSEKIVSPSGVER